MGPDTTTCLHSSGAARTFLARFFREIEAVLERRCWLCGSLLAMVLLALSLRQDLRAKL